MTPSRLAPWLLVVPAVAAAEIDPDCVGQVPEPYFEQVQSDYLQNSIALAATYSPIHGPLPNEPGAGTIGADFNVIPPLACGRRFALNASKTEATNKSPVLPRLRVGYTLPLSDRVSPYGSAAWLPPIAVAGQRSSVISAEAGVGWVVADPVALGARVHATAMKTIADAATSLDEDGAVALDLYLAHTFGADLLFGTSVGAVNPFISVGLTDASTLFWIGDDGVMVNNMHPYFGPVVSVGADGLVGMLRWGAELYAAPGGHSRPDPRFRNQVGFAGYGHMYTLRLRFGLELGASSE